VRSGARGLKAAALLILGYAISVAVNAGIYLSASGDPGEPRRLIVRLGGAVALVFGLWTGARWAWWLGVLFTGGLAALGVSGLYVAATTELLELRPYPAVDVTFLVVSIVLLAGAFVVLLLPPSCEAAGVGPKG